MVSDLDYQFEDLWYIQTRGAGDKRPKHEWGGYGQSFEDAEKVYTHEDVQKFPSEHWAVCGVKDKPHMSRSLLVFDLDVHKAAENDDSPQNVKVDEGTPLIKSQNGGFHVPFFIRDEKNSLSDSDFEVDKYISWDVDIKGSAVGGHVVAPTEIPGVDGSYEIVKDEPIPTVSDPRDACARVTLHGEPLLSYDPDTSISGEWTVDRDTEPPEDMPQCYHAGLQLRAENPEDHPNTHKVNTLTALCGLAAGYSIDEMVAHYCDEYAPGENADEEQTRYQLEHMATKVDRGDLAPPAIPTLREYGILAEDETCRCDIEYHGHQETNHLPSSDSSNSDGSGQPPAKWDHVRAEYEDHGEGPGRQAAVNTLEQTHDWMYVMEEDRLWVYDDETGCFTPWGEQAVARITEGGLSSHWSKSEKNEIVARLEARNQTRRDELNGQAKDGMYLCVGNGVVDLATGQLSEHDPDYKFTRGLEWDYEPADADPEPVLEFLDDITKREEDRDTLLDHLAHGLMPGHPFRAFVITYGPGSNGKTQMGELLRGFVGKENAASVELQDLTGKDDFATGALPGSFINIGDDVSVGHLDDLSILKSLTGGGEMRANEKFEKKYDFKNEAAMFFSANEPPRINEESEAIGDRLYPIEMPYRFVDQPDPESAIEKAKVPGIASALVNDKAAMRGLLLLAVKHAQELIENNGQYSMPEGPRERRARYEAASDPIKRFLVDCVKPGSQSDAVLKDDAYTVYTALCERDDERTTTDNVFKDQISKQTLIDVEPSTTRKLTSGDDQPTCWRYMQFTDDAKELMPPRLTERYFGESDTKETDTDESEDSENVAYNATQLTNAAESLTGYVTVTAEIVKVESYGETTKAILKDESGAMDLVTWDSALASHITGLEGETVVIEDAEVGEHDGTRQLQPVDGLTEISTIQAGVGHTQGRTPDDGQAGLADAATDGGDELTDKSRIRQYLANCESNETVTAAQVAGECDVSPDTAKSALEDASEEGQVQMDGDGWLVR